MHLSAEHSAKKHSTMATAVRWVVAVAPVVVVAAAIGSGPALVIAMMTMGVVHVALMRAMRRKLAAGGRLGDEDCLRLRAERLALAQVNVLELIASGTSPIRIQLAAGEMVAAETGGVWSVGPDGLTTADSGAVGPGDDIACIVERLLNLMRDRDRRTSELTYRATHDALTGVANRASILETVSHSMRQRKTVADTAILYLDLDRFKEVNDSRGHDFGDALLIEVSERIKQSVREGDTVGRIGGDEFVVVLENLTMDQARIVAERMSSNIRAPFTIGGTPINIGASIGIAMAEPGDRDADKLIREADQAMYRAKAGGMNYADSSSAV